MKMKILILTLFAFVLMASCYNEDKLIATADPENVYSEYTLPQGNHDYDEQIMRYYEKYGVLTLYKFRDKDFWWNSTSDIRWNYIPESNRTEAGYEALPADTLYVKEQLGLLENKFFTYYPDSLLKRTLPQKFLLASMFNYVSTINAGEPTEDDRMLVNFYSGYDYFGVNWGNAHVNVMTEEQKNTFKIDANNVFLKRLLDKKQISSSNEFIGISDYSQKITEDNMYSLGFVEQSTQTPNDDWRAYIKLIISTPYSVLVGEGGVLTDDVDVSTKIRQKYLIVIDFFKTEYNIDLQVIGDDVE